MRTDNRVESVESVETELVSPSTNQHFQHPPENRRLFTEKQRNFALNRRLARYLEIHPARIADGTAGIAVFHGSNLAVFTRAEAAALANAIVDELETQPGST